MKIEISEDDSNYMYQIIQKVIDECGPRMPCSSQEARAAEIIKKEFEKVCDDASIETFSCQPRAFLGFIKIEVVLVLASFLIIFLIPYNLMNYWTEIACFISFCLNIVSFIILWNEFLNYREFVDPLFKTKISQNVIGTIKPTGEKKKILIFSGHHDSALQFNLLWHLKIGYPIIIFVGLGVMLLWLVISAIIFLLSIVGLFFYDKFFLFGAILFFIGIPALIGLFLFTSPGEKANKVPGAVDNLSAVAVVLEIGNYLKKHKQFILKDTEIRLISFGCEEAGLRGAYRYVEKHHEELKDNNSVCINMDAIQSLNDISIVDFEPSTRTRHSKMVVEKITNAAKLAEIEIKTSALGGSSLLEKIIGQISGGTDATAFSKAGINAINISAMNLKKMLKFYHQPTDTPDKIEKGTLEDVLKICLGYIINESKK